jgi:hypothetical protein
MICGMESSLKRKCPGTREVFNIGIKLLKIVGCTLAKITPKEFGTTLSPRQVVTTVSERR